VLPPKTVFDEEHDEDDDELDEVDPRRVVETNDDWCPKIALINSAHSSGGASEALQSRSLRPSSKRASNWVQPPTDAAALSQIN